MLEVIIAILDITLIGEYDSLITINQEVKNDIPTTSISTEDHRGKDQRRK